MPERLLKFHISNGRRRILVVEDEFINREMLRLILGPMYDITMAGTGTEALERIRAEHDTLSLVLLDLNLPDKHGLDVLRELKGDPRTARLPVIVMTADKDAEVESLSIGAIDFIPKPYPQPKVILARVLRTIELSEDRDLIRWTERDRLTGLYSREFFFRYAAQFDAYNPDRPTDAIVIDINHFHMLNERYGRGFGDEVLRAVSEKLRELVSEEDGLVCRREADTFLVYCAHRGDYEAMLESVSVPMSADGKNVGRLRLRMGVYSDTDKSIDLERRFDRAKLAADNVKNSFMQTLGIYDDSLHDAEVLAEQLLVDFPAAVRERQLEVYYQPKFDIREEEPLLSSAEALVRWKHPQLGMVSPGVFIPLFEKNGLIRELDEFVWREAAARIRDWKERLGVSVPVSINVSRVDLYDPLLLDKLEGIVAQNGLDHRELLLEVTESAYTEDSAQIVEMVKRLREKGFRIEMDDFGSGYSSLNMLSTLPLDALKLDMEFIRSAFRERKDTRLLEFVIRLAESLEVPTIAEGVETAEQLFTLKSMGCDIVQGYYFSRPVPAAEFERFVTEKRAADSPFREGRARRGQDRFTYAALHDPLTGLYNRSAFEILFHDSDQEHIAVLLAELDDYAAIREAKGADYADRLILRAAAVLRENFRSVDVICRLKDDQFVILMTRMKDSMRALVFNKVDRVNAALREPGEGLEPVSVSVGVAFSDREKPDGDVFEDAETALVRMKEVRHRGCAVF